MQFFIIFVSSEIVVKSVDYFHAYFVDAAQYVFLSFCVVSEFVFQELETVEILFVFRISPKFYLLFQIPILFWDIMAEIGKTDHSLPN